MSGAPIPIRSHWKPGSRHLKSAKVVQQEFDGYLKCALLEYGFLRLKCDGCQHERLVAFSCKRRGCCPSCGARRMVESAAHLVDHVLPRQPIRQWVLTFPYPLRFLFAAKPKVLSQVLGVVYRAISTFLIKRAGFAVASGAKTGAVTLIQRFGSALNLNFHFHMLFLDGVYSFDRARPRFHRARRRPLPNSLGCYTPSADASSRFETAPPTSFSTRSTLSPAWPHSCRARDCTSHDFTGYLRPTANIVSISCRAAMPAKRKQASLSPP